MPPDLPLVTQIIEATAGGVARHLELIARALPPRGFRLRFLLSLGRDPGYIDRVEDFRREGIEVDIVPMVRSIRPWRDWPALRRIAAILRATRPDLVHTHSSKGGFLGRRAAWSAGIPAVHTPHVLAFEWARNPLSRAIYRFAERRAARWCDRLILLSDAQKELAFEAGLGLPETLEVVPNGVDAGAYRPPTPDERRAARARFGLAPEDKVVGMAARLEPQKGVGHFLRAAHILRREMPDVRFIVAGEGCLKDEFRRRVEALNLAGHLTFCGNIPHMQAFYHGLDCFVLASLWEGLPYVILEAQASGLPVVASRTLGAEALIEDGETGLLAPITHEEKLATGMRRILSEPNLAEYLGRWARARVASHFTLDRWADGLAAVYREVLAGRHSASSP